MDKVLYRVDPDSTFPHHYSGEVRVTLRNGHELVHREAVNRGHPERPMTNEDVRAKFMENACLHFSEQHANAVCAQVLELDTLARASTLEDLLAQDPAEQGQTCAFPLSPPALAPFAPRVPAS